MRIAALYDVHGNRPALDAVLADPAFARADVVVVERSEERRVGKECSKQCRSRWSPYH